MNDLLEVLKKQGDNADITEISVKLASSEQVRSWSYGESKKT